MKDPLDYPDDPAEQTPVESAAHYVDLEESSPPVRAEVIDDVEIRGGLVTVSEVETRKNTWWVADEPLTNYYWADKHADAEALVEYHIDLCERLAAAGGSDDE